MNDFPDGNARLLVVAGAKPASAAAPFTSPASRNRIAGASRCRLRYGDGDTAFASALGACKTATSVPPGAQSRRKLCIDACKSTYSKSQWRLDRKETYSVSEGKWVSRVL